ncbi:hypothetical protein GCK72_015956 [Caenorhabditis remanei]|uniref:G-protein coupled receptors family 1 profile domain-containing protein n=1 Tax=Caenorhabditis remanei TaxID=31234 RepID=A0A6A5GXV9_CAERE|nr:hypothetical protein GCK72_015956 [Caenorhabditis remanei]KAF1759489.1 hypothetical protein GCK72_015956 [Caenorhabditis remanei]
MSLSTTIPPSTSSGAPSGAPSGALDKNDHWLLNTLATAVPGTIGVVIIVFNLIGNFGNFNVIAATWRSKNLQSKHGWLLVILCSEHSLCLLFEFINVYFALSGVQITRRSCLLYLSPYIFISFLQSTTFIALAIDVLLSFTVVSRYQKWQTTGYCSVMAFSPCVLPIAFLTRLWSQVSDEIIFLCNPPLSMDAKAVNIWGGLISSINITILLIYGYVYFYSHQTKKRTSDSKMAEKIMRSLTILVMVFCFSWVTCMGMVFLVDYFTENPIIIMLVRSYAVIFAAISYSQTFYVYYIRSEMYRKEFKKQMCCEKADAASGGSVIRIVSRSTNI